MIQPVVRKCGNTASYTWLGAAGSADKAARGTTLSPVGLCPRTQGEGPRQGGGFPECCGFFPSRVTARRPGPALSGSPGRPRTFGAGCPA